MVKFFASVRACFLLCLFLGGLHIVMLAGLVTRFGETMPQVVKGEGALAVMFGDARDTISRAFAHKADTYYHGGVNIDCHHLSDRNHHDHGGDHDHECCDHHSHDCNCHHDDHDGDHEYHGDPHDDDHDDDHEETVAFSDDPWRWINVHVRAPEIHKHLDGAESVELMPWLWASVKASPHNIDAWTTAWHIANNSMNNKKLALNVIDEGLKHNPDDPELLLCRGRTFYDRGSGDVTAARAAFLVALESADRVLKRDGDKAEMRIKWVRKFAQTYLDEIAKKGTRP